MNRKTIFVFLISNFIWLCAISQTDSLDLLLLQQSDYTKTSIETYYPNTAINSKRVIHDSTARFNPLRSVLYGLFYLYQNLISEQISASCLYEMTCSNFGKHSISYYGPLKGFFLALDRVTRCSGLVYHEIPDHKHNQQTSRVMDVPKYYQLKKQ